MMKLGNPLLIGALVLAFLASACQSQSTQEMNSAAEDAWTLLRCGDDAMAMKALLQLADDYHAKKDFDNESIFLFCAAQVYLQQLDTIGMQGILAKMENLADAHPDLPNVVYSYLTVKQTVHAILFQKAGRTEDRDLMLSEGARAIGLMEKMTVEQWRAYRVNPVWNYYNMAVGYDMYFDAPVRDSIAYYLGKAREVNQKSYHLEESIHQECTISIGDEQAWLYYYDGEYQKAEEEMFKVLALIDSVEAKTPNVVETERIEAYDFLVELYANTGRPEKALEYQKLKSEAELQRMSVERNESVHKVEAQYNVAKEQAKVEHLRWMLVTLAGIMLLLVGAVLYLHLWRRNRMQEQYSAAVEALVNTDKEVSALTGGVSTEKAGKIFASALKPLSAVERKYILLFMSGKTTEEIADAMHVAPASVYTMKYRIKKKYPAGFPLPF